MFEEVARRLPEIARRRCTPGSYNVVPCKCWRGTMFILLKSLARTLILPPASLLIVAVIGLLLMPRRRRLGVALIVISLGSLWVCATPAVSDVLTRFAERYPPLDPSKPVDAQAIVILGGGGVRMAPEYGGWAAEADALERVSYAAFLVRRTGLPVLVSGTREEAQGMSATLTRDLGVRVRWAENHDGLRIHWLSRVKRRITLDETCQHVRYRR